MGSSYLTNPLSFVLGTLISLYIMIVMLRFILALVRADFYNPVSQFLVKATNPLLVPLRRLLPAIGRLDTASMVLMLGLQLLAFWLMATLKGAAISLPHLLLGSLAELVNLTFNVFIFAILIQVILSWVSPGAHSPVTSVLYSLTEPVMRPVRRFIPPMGGFDLSPIFALLGLNVLRMLVLPLFHLI